MKEQTIIEAGNKEWPIHSGSSPHQQMENLYCVDAFVKGAKFVLEQQWIDATIQPNERILTVLACNMNAPEYNQHAFIATWFGQIRTFRFDNYGALGSVTHYMPLPELPKSPKQNDI